MTRARFGSLASPRIVIGWLESHERLISQAQHREGQGVIPRSREDAKEEREEIVLWFACRGILAHK